MKRIHFFAAAAMVAALGACSGKYGADEVRQTAPADASMQHRRQAQPDGIVSLDIVNDRNRLHRLIGKHEAGATTLWYQSSDDGGRQWSDPVRIPDDNAPANVDRGKDAQIVARGDEIVAVWMQYKEQARFHAGPMQAARSEDGGKTWSRAPAPPDWAQGPHGYYDLAGDGRSLHAVWLDSRGGPSGINATQSLQYARSDDGGRSWQRNVTLDEITCSCCWNTVKSDGAGNTYVLYRDKQPSDMAVGRIDRDGRWQRLGRVGEFDWQFEGCPHIGGGLAMQRDAGGLRLHAVVGSGQADHLGVFYLRSADGGSLWSAPKQLGDESAQHADIAANDGGRVVAVWDMLGDDGLAVFASESSDNGIHWSAAEKLSEGGARASHPRIVETKDGFLALWTQQDGHKLTLASRRF